jgi:hypothetical protein
MTSRPDGDRCPACGSDDVIPFAFIFGSVEIYGYQCSVCLATWLVPQAEDRHDAVAVRSLKEPAA